MIIYPRQEFDRNKILAYGEWTTVNTCPNCFEYVSRAEIYDNRCCRNCGESGVIMLAFNVTTIRRAYLRKSWIPFRSKYVVEVKCVEPRFSGNGGHYVAPNHLRHSGANLTMAAAAISIF